MSGMRTGWYGYPRPRLLGQVRPLSSLNVTMFNTEPGSVITMTSLVVCNTTGAARLFRIFSPPTGSIITDESTAVFWDQNIAATSGLVYSDLFLDVPSLLAVRSSFAGGLTFSAYGF